tara:strand:- start:95 stop:376 length:282 start_codon:yes stop_codon:yes gene_type:complete
MRDSPIWAFLYSLIVFLPLGVLLFFGKNIIPSKSIGDSYILIIVVIIFLFPLFLYLKIIQSWKNKRIISKKLIIILLFYILINFFSAIVVFYL